MPESYPTQLHVWCTLSPGTRLSPSALHTTNSTYRGTAAPAARDPAVDGQGSVGYLPGLSVPRPRLKRRQLTVPSAMHTVCTPTPCICTPWRRRQEPTLSFCCSQEIHSYLTSIVSSLPNRARIASSRSKNHFLIRALSRPYLILDCVAFPTSSPLLFSQLPFPCPSATQWHRDER